MLATVHLHQLMTEKSHCALSRPNPWTGNSHQPSPFDVPGLNLVVLYHTFLPASRLKKRSGAARRGSRGRAGRKGLEHEGHESTRNTRKEVLSASRLSCPSRPFAAFVIQMPLEPLMPLRKTPLSVVSVLFRAVSDSSTCKTPASGRTKARPWLASGSGMLSAVSGCVV